MSPKKETPKELLSKHLGAKAANTLLKKIDQMAAKGATAARIESAVNAEIATHMEKQILNALKVKIGPLEPIKIKPIQVGIKPTIKPTVTSGIKVNSSVKIGPPISVKTTPIKVGPPTYTRGTRRR